MRRSFYARAEWGGSKFGCFMALLLIGGLALLGFKLLPPIINNYQFEDAVGELASFSLVKNPSKLETPTSALTNEILKKAEEMELPIEKNDIKVSFLGEHVEVTISYVVPVTFPGYTYDYQFNIRVRK